MAHPGGRPTDYLGEINKCQRAEKRYEAFIKQLEQLYDFSDYWGDTFDNPDRLLDKRAAKKINNRLDKTRERLEEVKYLFKRHAAQLQLQRQMQPIAPRKVNLMMAQDNAGKIDQDAVALSASKLLGEAKNSGYLMCTEYVHPCAAGLPK